MHNKKKRISREPYPGFKKEKRERDAKINKATRASSQPLPGPVRDAFLPQPTLKKPAADIRAFVHADFPVLVALDSPLYRRLLELGKDEKKQKKIAFTDEEEAEMIFQFTRPCREVEAILKREGREGFRNVALDAVRYNEETPLPPPFYEKALAQIVQNLAASYGTIVHFESVKSETSFTAPSPDRQTASGGGSTTSAD